MLGSPRSPLTTHLNAARLLAALQLYFRALVLLCSGVARQPFVREYRFLHWWISNPNRLKELARLWLHVQLCHFFPGRLPSCRPLLGHRLGQLTGDAKRAADCLQQLQPNLGRSRVFYARAFRLSQAREIYGRGLVLATISTVRHQQIIQVRTAEPDALEE